MMTRDQFVEYLEWEDTPYDCLSGEELYGYLTGLALFTRQPDDKAILEGLWREDGWKPPNFHQHAEAEAFFWAQRDQVAANLAKGVCEIEMTVGVHCADWAQGMLFALELFEKEWAEFLRSDKAWLARPIRAFEKVDLNDRESLIDRLSAHENLPSHVIAIYRHLRGLLFEMSDGLLLPKVGRNDPCLCGSGSKYKKCHGR